MRQRTLDPGFWAFATGNMSMFERVLFLSMTSLADDEGRLKADALSLKTAIFPADDIPLEDIEHALHNLAATCPNVLVVYEADGVPFVAFLRWNRYQRIQHGYLSQLPPPPSVIITPRTYSTPLRARKYGALSYRYNNIMIMRYDNAPPQAEISPPYTSSLVSKNKTPESPESSTLGTNYSESDSESTTPVSNSPRNGKAKNHSSSGLIHEKSSPGLFALDGGQSTEAPVDPRKATQKAFQRVAGMYPTTEWLPKYVELYERLGEAEFEKRLLAYGGPDSAIGGYLGNHQQVTQYLAEGKITSRGNGAPQRDSRYFNAEGERYITVPSNFDPVSCPGTREYEERAAKRLENARMDRQILEMKMAAPEQIARRREIFHAGERMDPAEDARLARETLERVNAVRATRGLMPYPSFEVMVLQAPMPPGCVPDPTYCARPEGSRAARWAEAQKRASA